MSSELCAVREKRLEDVDLNSRGLLSLRFYDVRIIKASGRRESAVRVAVPRLCRRHFFFLSLFHGFDNPRLFALAGFASFRRF